MIGFFGIKFPRRQQENSRAMNNNPNEEIVTTPFQSAFNTVAQYSNALASGDTECMASLRSDTFELDIVHRDAFKEDPLTAEEASDFWPSWISAFPEMDYRVTRTIAGEKVVITQWVFTGTNSGALCPPVFDKRLEPTGKTVKFRGISVYEISANLVQRETTYIDLGTLLVELDVML